jgi:pimeloyl-ACP methyl ester carboxylesterase
MQASTQNDVAGVVIVDHADLLPPSLPGSISGRNGDRSMAAPPVMNGAREADADKHFQKLSTRDYQLHLWANSLPGYSKVMERDLAMIPECASEVETASRNLATPLNDKPLIVLSRSWGQMLQSSSRIPGPAGQYAELQSKLLSLSSNSKQVVVENSGHYMMVDRPEVVTEAIRDVVNAHKKSHQAEATVRLDYLRLRSAW